MNHDDVLGISDNKDHFSGQLELVLPLGFMYGFALLYRKRARGAFFLALSAARFAAITSSLSKMGFISMLGSLFAMGAVGAAYWIPGRKKWTAVGGLVVLVVLVFLLLPSMELVEAFGAAASDPDRRGAHPYLARYLHLATAYPLLGSGFGTYFPAFLRYQTAALHVAWIHAHKDYLELLSNVGIAGFVVVAALMGSVLTLAVRMATSAQTRERCYLGLACAGSMSAILIHSLADFNMYIPANAITLSWIAGFQQLFRAEPSRSNRTALS